MFDILAILGRGIQWLESHGQWVLTEDLEVCGENGGHLIVRVPADDENPNCLVGGGELNLQAGLELYREDAKIVVCAYSWQAKYLREVGAPSESQIMSAMFLERARGINLPEPIIQIWDENVLYELPSNTNRELQNIFELAVSGGFSRVALLTVAVHLPRTMLFTRKHLEHPAFQGLKVGFFSAEQVLLGANAEFYAPRIMSLRRSKAFQRSAVKELKGIQDFLTGDYHSVG